MFLKSFFRFYFLIIFSEPTLRYGVRLLITEFTFDKLGDKTAEMLYRQIDHVAVKGKNKPCKIFEVIDADSPPVKRAKELLLDDYSQGVKYFTQGDFARAKEHFTVSLNFYEISRFLVTIS